MIRAIKLPAELAEPAELVELEQTDVDAYRKIIGGPLEVVLLDNPSSALYIHDEGKLEGLPLNIRANALAWVHNSAIRGRDVIVGNALLVGPADKRAYERSAPKYYHDMMFTQGRVAIEYRREQVRGWVKSGVLFTKWESAYHFAADFMNETPDITRLRVVPVS